MTRKIVISMICFNSNLYNFNCDDDTPRLDYSMNISLQQHYPYSVIGLNTILRPELEMNAHICVSRKYLQEKAIAIVEWIDLNPAHISIAAGADSSALA